MIAYAVYVAVVVFAFGLCDWVNSCCLLMWVDLWTIGCGLKNGSI